MVTYIKLDIASTTYTDLLSTNVTNTIGDNNSSSHFTVQLKNINGIYSDTFSINDEVEIWAEKDVSPATTKIFTGIIEDIKFKGKEQDETITISGRDYTARLMDRNVEPEVYNDDDIADIVIDIMDKYVDTITRTNVTASTGITLNHISFNQTPVYDALKQLAEMCDHIFWVDTNKDLHFQSKGVTSSGETLNNTNVRKATFKETDREVYNDVWVYGDTFLTGREDTFTGTGTGSVFTLAFKPHNTNVTVNGSIQYGGVFGIYTDVPSGVQYLVDYHDKQIIFASGTACGDNIPALNGSITTSYQWDRRIVKHGTNEESIARYGKKTKIIVDRNIMKPKQAADTVSQTLDLFSEPRKQGNIDLQNIVYLVPGQTVIVNLPNHNIDNVTYTILESKYIFTQSSMLSDEVLKVKVADKIKDVVDTIKQILLDMKKMQAADTSSEILTRMMWGAGSAGFRVKTWALNTNAIGSEFIIGHPINSELDGNYHMWDGTYDWTYSTSGGEA